MTWRHLQSHFCRCMNPWLSWFEWVYRVLKALVPLAEQARFCGFSLRCDPPCKCSRRGNQNSSFCVRKKGSVGGGPGGKEEIAPWWILWILKDSLVFVGFCARHAQKQYLPMQIHISTGIHLLDPKLRAMMPGWGGQIPRRGVIPRHCFQKFLSEMPLKCMWKMWTVWGTFASKGSRKIYRWLIGSTLAPGWLRCRAVQQQVLRLAVWWWRVWSLGWSEGGFGSRLVGETWRFNCNDLGCPIAIFEFEDI